MHQDPARPDWCGDLWGRCQHGGSASFDAQDGRAAGAGAPNRDHAHAGEHDASDDAQRRRRLAVIRSFAFVEEVPGERAGSCGGCASDDDVRVIGILAGS